MPQTRVSNLSKAWDLEQGPMGLDGPGASAFDAGTGPLERSSQRQPATASEMGDGNELRRDVAELRYAVTELRQVVNQFSQESALQRAGLRGEKWTSLEQKALESRPRTS